MSEILAGSCQAVYLKEKRLAEIKQAAEGSESWQIHLNRSLAAAKPVGLDFVN